MGLSFPGMGTQLEKLWEGQVQFAEFLPQKISLDLSAYKALLIRSYMGDNTASMEAEQTIIFVDGVTTLMKGMGAGTLSNFLRSAKAEASGITFGECRGGADAGTHNQYLVPYEIYGIMF